MKTAEDLFRDYAASTLSGVDSKLMNLKMFRSALTFHDKEIISKIEDIENIGIGCIEYVGSANYHEREMEAKRKFRTAITELKQFIEEKL